MGNANKTRSLILETARNAIGRVGYSAATIDSIAEEAGVSKGVVYYHFKSKADIATTLLTETMDTVCDSLNKASAWNEDPANCLRDMASAFASQVFENREFSRFVITEMWRNGRDWSEQMRAEEERLAQVIDEKLQEGIRVGVIRADVDTRFATISIIGSTLMTAQYYLMLDDCSEEFFVDHLVDYIRHALQA